MADYEDGEEQALGWLMMAILKATKNMARNKQKKPKVDPKFGDRK
jgi:Asp-tRNA(Asn)/Glu-tRNA(Gln) amidotransferase B subunit